MRASHIRLTLMGSSVTLNNGSIFNLDGGQETIGPLTISGSTNEIYTPTTDGTKPACSPSKYGHGQLRGQRDGQRQHQFGTAADNGHGQAPGPTRRSTATSISARSTARFDVDGYLWLNANVSGTGALNKTASGQ